MSDSSAEATLKRFAIEVNAGFAQAPSLLGILQVVCDVATSRLGAKVAQVVSLPVSGAPFVMSGGGPVPDNASSYGALFDDRGALVRRATGEDWYFALSDHMRLLLFLRGELTSAQRELTIAMCLLTQSLLEAVERSEIALAEKNAAAQRVVGSGVTLVLVGSSPEAVTLRSVVVVESQRDDDVCLHGGIGSGRRQLARAIHEASMKRGRFPFVLATGETLAATLAGASSLEAIAGSGTFCIEGEERAPANTVAQLHMLCARAHVTRVIYSSLGPRDGMRNYAVPAIGMRMGDLEAMAKVLLPMRTLTKSAITTLGQLSLPGGFADLRRVLEASAATAGIEIDESAIASSAGTDGFVLESAMQSFEKQWILRVLAAHRDHRLQTAKALGISRQSLSRRLKDWGMSGDGDE